MPLPVWIGFGVLILATAGGAVFVVLRGIEAWQTFRSSGRTMETALSDVLERAARTEERAAALETAEPRLQRSLERLRVGLEVLQIQLRVLQDVRAPLLRARAIVLPRK
jgi:hypothetical protein